MKFSKFIALSLSLALSIEPTVPLYARTPGDVDAPPTKTSFDTSQPVVSSTEAPEVPANEPSLMPLEAIDNPLSVSTDTTTENPSTEPTPEFTLSPSPSVSSIPIPGPTPTPLPSVFLGLTPNTFSESEPYNTVPGPDTILLRPASGDNSNAANDFLLLRPDNNNNSWRFLVLNGADPNAVDLASAIEIQGSSAQFTLPGGQQIQISISADGLSATAGLQPAAPQEPASNPEPVSEPTPPPAAVSTNATAQSLAAFFQGNSLRITEDSTTLNFNSMSLTGTDCASTGHCFLTFGREGGESNSIRLFDSLNNFALVNSFNTGGSSLNPNGEANAALYATFGLSDLNSFRWGLFVNDTPIASGAVRRNESGQILGIDFLDAAGNIVLIFDPTTSQIIMPGASAPEPSGNAPAPEELIVNGRSEPDPMNFGGPAIVFDPPAGFTVMSGAPTRIQYFEGSPGNTRGIDFVTGMGSYRLQIPPAPGGGSGTLTIPLGDTVSPYFGTLEGLGFNSIPDAFAPFSFTVGGSPQPVFSAVITYDDAGNPASVSFRDGTNNSFLRFAFPEIPPAELFTAEEGDMPVITEDQLRLDVQDEGPAEEDGGEPQELSSETRSQMQSALGELNYALQRVMTVGDIDESALNAIRSANQTIRNFDLLNHRDFSNTYRDLMDRIGAFSNTIGNSAPVATPPASDLSENDQNLLNDLTSDTLRGIRVQQSIIRTRAWDRDNLWMQALSQTDAREQWNNTPVTMGGIAYNNYAVAYENEIRRAVTRLNNLMDLYRQEAGPRLRALADQFQSERPEAPATLTPGQVFRNGFINELAFFAENFGLPQAGQDMGVMLDDLRTRASQAVQAADARGESIPQEQQALVFNLIDLFRSALPAAIAPPPADGQVTFVDTNGVTRTGTLRLGEIPPGTVRSDNPFTAGVGGVFTSEDYEMVWNGQSVPIQSVEVRKWLADGKMWMEEKSSSGLIARQKGYIVQLQNPTDNMQTGPTGPKEWRVTEVDYTDGTTDRGEPPPYDLVPEFLQQAMRTSVSLPDGTEARVVLPAVNVEGGKKLAFVNPYLLEVRQGGTVLSWQANLESLTRIPLNNPAERLAEARRAAQGMMQAGNNALLNAVIAGTMGQLRYDAERSAGAQLNFTELLAQFLIDLTGNNSSESQTNATADTGGRSTLRWPGALSLTIAPDSAVANGNLTFVAEYTENGVVTRRIPAFFGRLSEAPQNFVPSDQSGIARLGYGLVVLEGYRQGWRTYGSAPYLDSERKISGWIEREYRDAGSSITLSMFSTVVNQVDSGILSSGGTTETRWVTRGNPRISSGSSSNGVEWDFSRGGEWIFLNQAQTSTIPSVFSAIGQSLASNPLTLVPRLAIQGSSAFVSMAVSGARYTQAEIFYALGIDLAVENELSGISNDIAVMNQYTMEEDLQALQRGEVPSSLTGYLDRAKAAGNGGGTLVLDYMVRLRRTANTRPDAQTGSRPGTRDAIINAPVTDAQRAFELVRWKTPGELSNLRAMAGEDVFLNSAMGFLGNANRTIADMGPMLIALHFLGAAGAAAARVPATAEAVAVTRAVSGLSSVSQANVFTQALRFSSTYVQWSMMPGMAFSLPQHIADAVNAFSEGRYTDFSDSATGAIMDGIFTYMIASGAVRSLTGGGGSSGAPDGFTSGANGLIDAIQGWRPGTSAALMPFVGAIPRIRNNSNRQTLIDQSARVESLQNQINQLAPSEQARINQLNVQLRNTLQGMRYLVELDFVQNTMAEMSANRDPSTLSGEEGSRFELLRTRADHINQVLREVYPNAVPGGEIVLNGPGGMSSIGNSSTNISQPTRPGQTNLTPGQTAANTRPVSTRPGRPPGEASEAAGPISSNQRFRLPDGRAQNVKPEKGQIIRFQAPDQSGRMQWYEFNGETNTISQVIGETVEGQPSTSPVTFGGDATLQAGRWYRLSGNADPFNFSGQGEVAIRVSADGTVRFNNTSGASIRIQAAVEISASGANAGTVAAGARVAVTTDGTNLVNVVTPEGTFTIELNPANANVGTWSYTAWENGTTRVSPAQLPFQIIRGNAPGDFLIQNMSGQSMTVEALPTGGRTAAIRNYATYRAPLPQAASGTTASDVYTIRLYGENHSAVRYRLLADGNYEVSYSYPNEGSSTGFSGNTRVYTAAEMQSGITVNGSGGQGLVRLRLVSSGERAGIIVENLTGTEARMSVSDRASDGRGQQIVSNNNNTTRPAEENSNTTNDQTARDTQTAESTPIDPNRPATQPDSTAARNRAAQLLAENINAVETVANSRILDFVRDPANLLLVEALIGSRGANESLSGYHVRASMALKGILETFQRNAARPIEIGELRDQIAEVISERIAEMQRLNRNAAAQAEAEFGSTESIENSSPSQERIPVDPEFRLDLSTPPPQQVIEAPGRVPAEGSSIQRFEGPTQFTTENGGRFTVSRAADGTLRVSVEGQGETGTEFRIGDQQIRVSVEGESGVERITIESERVTSQMTLPDPPRANNQTPVEEPPARLEEPPAETRPAGTVPINNPTPPPPSRPAVQSAGIAYVEISANETVIVNGIEIRPMIQTRGGVNSPRIYSIEVSQNGGSFVEQGMRISLGNGVEVEIGSGANSSRPILTIRGEAEIMPGRGTPRIEVASSERPPAELGEEFFPPDPAEAARTPAGDARAPQIEAPQLSAREVLESATRRVRIRDSATNEIVEIEGADPVAQEVLNLVNAEEILALIPPGSRYLTGGFESVVLETTTGEILRISPRQTRPSVLSQDGQQLVLQPLAPTEVRGLWQVERLPRVRTSGITEADVQAMEQMLGQVNWRFSDAGMDNLGITSEGSLVVIDPGAVRPILPPAPMPVLPEIVQPGTTSSIDVPGNDLAMETATEEQGTPQFFPLVAGSVITNTLSSDPMPSPTSVAEPAAPQMIDELFAPPAANTDFPEMPTPAIVSNEALLAPVENAGPEIFTNTPVTPDALAAVNNLINENPEFVQPLIPEPPVAEPAAPQLIEMIDTLFAPNDIPLPRPSLVASPSISNSPAPVFVAAPSKQGSASPIFEAPRPTSLISQDIPSLASGNQNSQPQSQSSEEFLSGTREEVLPPELLPFNAENLSELNLPPGPLDSFGLPVYDLLSEDQNAYLDWLTGNADLMDLAMIQNIPADLPQNPAPEASPDENNLAESFRLTLGDSPADDLPSWARDLLSGTAALSSLESGSNSQMA